MKSNKGFTLIELLVVVLIIGILAAIAVPQYQKAVAKNRLVQALTLSRQFKDAEETYYLANNKYTTDFDALSISIPHQVRTTDGEDFKVITLSNKYLLEIAINGYSGNNRITVYLPEYLSYPSLLHGIINYLDNSVPGRTETGRRCFGDNKTYQKACESMGGVESGGVGGHAKAYVLP